MKKYDAVIFDIDGTLWDVTKILAMAYNDASKEFSFDEKEFTPDQMKQELGLPLVTIFDHLYPEIKERYSYDEREAKNVLQIVMEISTGYEYRYLRALGGDLYPNLKETLLKLKEQYPLFIVSNCEKGYVELFTESSKMEGVFEDHLCYGDTGKDKAQTIRILSEKHKLKNPVYVGDILNDALSCKEAGVDFIWASYGFGNVSEDMYSEKINEFSELEKLLIE